MAFFVAPWPSRVAVRCAAAGLPPAGATGRCARSQDLATVHRSTQAQRAAERTGWRGGGCSPRPAPQAKVVYFHLSLLDGRRVRDGRWRCAHAPHTRPRARTAISPTPRPDHGRESRPPPAPRPRFALAAPPLPTPRGPAHPPHAIHTARAPLGLARPLAVPSGATSNVASDRATNGLVAPRGSGARSSRCSHPCDQVLDACGVD